MKKKIDTDPTLFGINYNYTFVLNITYLLRSASKAPNTSIYYCAQWKVENCIKECGELLPIAARISDWHKYIGPLFFDSARIKRCTWSNEDLFCVDRDIQKQCKATHKPVISYCSTEVWNTESHCIEEHIFSAFQVQMLQWGSERGEACVRRVLQRFFAWNYYDAQKVKNTFGSVY